MRRNDWLWRVIVAATVVTPIVSTSRASTMYSIGVSTASVAGASGYLDFQFNPGQDSQPAFVQLLNFVSDGALNGAPQVSGTVTGALPTTVRIDNTTGFNDYFQSILFGQAINFVLDVDGPAITLPNGTSTSGSSFGIGLFDNNQNPILTTDPNGFAATIEINLDGTTTPQVFQSDSNGGSPTASISPMPEPTSVLLIGFGMGLLLTFFRPRGFRLGPVERPNVEDGLYICPGPQFDPTEFDGESALIGSDVKSTCP